MIPREEGVAARVEQGTAELSDSPLPVTNVGRLTESPSPEGHLDGSSGSPLHAPPSSPAQTVVEPQRRVFTPLDDDEDFDDRDMYLAMLTLMAIGGTGILTTKLLKEQDKRKPVVPQHRD